MPSIGYVSRSWQDYDGEIGVMKVYATVRTAANFDAQGALAVALFSAVDAITLGGLVKYEIGTRYTDPNPVKPNTTEAQRELKWLVSFHDGTTGRRYSCEIPCADTAALDPNDRAHAFIGDGDVVDQFVTDFEAFVLSPVGNAITVDEITLVGRRV